MAAETEPPDPVTFAGGVLDQYRHVCAFVKSQTEADAVLDPFVQDGLERDDRLLYLVDPAAPAAPLQRVRRLGYDPSGLLDQRRLTVLTWAETYLRTGAFDHFDGAFIIDILRTHPMV